MQVDYDVEYVIHPCVCGPCAHRPKVLGECNGWLHMLLDFRLISERTSRNAACETLLRVIEDKVVRGRRLSALPNITVEKVLQDMTAAEMVELRERITGVLRFPEPTPETSAPVC